MERKDFQTAAVNLKLQGHTSCALKTTSCAAQGA